MSTPTIATTTTTTSAAPITTAPTTAAPAATPGTGATHSDWTTGFNDDAKGYIQNKGWKGPTDLLDSYRNFEKLQGVPQDQILKLPKEDDTAGWDAVQKRLGKPDNASQYKLEDVAKGMDPELIKEQADAFHEAGLSRKQAEILAKKYAESLTSKTTAAKESNQTKAAQEITSLKKEWGMAYDQNCNAGKRAAAELGIDGATITQMESVLGTAKTLKLFQQIGSKFGEGSFVTGNAGGGGNGPMTPEQAKSKITQLRGDSDFVKKFSAGNSKELAEMHRLHQFAYPEVS